MTVINCKEHIKDGMFSLPFEDGPHWGMTVKAAGDMRYRIAETNVRRIDTLRRIAMSGSLSDFDAHGSASLDKIVSKRLAPLLIAQPELAHSKIVIDVKRAEDAFMRRVDGMISINHGLLLVVTVADCVPIFLFDRVRGAFGIVHSGWKGTGIAANAVSLMKSSYGTHPKDVTAVIGPHIQSMCYTVDTDRAALFQDAYGADCVEAVEECQMSGSSSDFDTHCSAPLGKIVSRRPQREYHLSLLKANLAVLHDAGVADENITAASDCTCCGVEYGSFRRETGGRLCAPFTVQAAFLGYVI